MSKCIIFTAKGAFARFRKPYTTTSALTYICMPPIAIKGMLGAILGIDKKEVFEYFKDVRIGVQVLQEIHKDMGSFNLLSMKNGELFRFPSNIEFLRNVAYRIFIQGEDDLVNQLEQILIKHEYVFMPYLGASEHIAQLTFEAVTTVQKSEAKETYCVIPKSVCDLKELVLDRIYTDKIPIQNNEKREYTRYEQVIIPVLRQKVILKGYELSKVGEYDVYFF